MIGLIFGIVLIIFVVLFICALTMDLGYKYKYLENKKRVKINKKEK